MIDVEAVQIVTGEVQGGGTPLAVAAPWVMMTVGAALTVGVMLHSLWRWYTRLDDAERAFLQMSLRLRLGRRERNVVRMLARAISAAPVALLVSQTAFSRAAEAIGRSEAGAAVQHAIARVEGRLFG